MQRTVIVAAVAAVLVAGFALAYVLLRPLNEPAVAGYLDGQEIKFMHTEVSDPKIAKILTDMIRSPVLTVPSLAQARHAMLARVYVFANGIKDGGPLKFQRDIFDNPPGTPGYSPLRRIMLVTWKTGPDPRILKSVAELNGAEAKGEVTIKDSGVVVTIPLLSWQGGHR
jgi:hypothetical protein